MLGHRLAPYMVALSPPSYISYMGNKSNLTSHRPYGQGSTFIYIFHFMSIDLQSSRSFFSSHYKAYSYEPGSHYLLSNQSTCCTINLLPRLRSHYFFHLCKYLKLLYLLNGRTIEHQSNQTSNINHIEH